MPGLGGKRTLGLVSRPYQLAGFRRGYVPNFTRQKEVDAGPFDFGRDVGGQVFVIRALVHPPSNVEDGQHLTVSHRDGRLLPVTLAKYRDYLGCSGR